MTFFLQKLNTVVSKVQRPPPTLHNPSDVSPAKRSRLVQPTKRRVRPKLLLDTLGPKHLLHIYKYLNPLDIANLSDTSHYLAKFATAHIYAKYANGELFNARKPNGRQRKFTMPEIRCILRHFGKYFKRLTINYNYFLYPTTAHVTLFMRRCPNLDELRIQNFYFKTAAVAMLKKVQCPARHLILQCEGITNRWRNLLMGWPRVTQLTVYSLTEDLLVELLTGIHPIKWLTMFNVGIHDYKFMEKLQIGQKQYLRKCSMFNMYDFTSPENHYSQMPHLQQLQITVGKSTDLNQLRNMKLKHLQLVYCMEFGRKEPTVLNWSLDGLHLLEELDLVGIDGDVCRVAANVPTLRVLSIQKTNIQKGDGLAETIAQLPSLHRLRLRKCTFSHEDLVQVINTNSSLTQIDLELTDKGSVVKLLETLAANDSPTVRSTLEVRIITAKTDVSILNLCHSETY